MRYSCRAVVGHGQFCEPNYQCDACAAKQKYMLRIEQLEAALRHYICDCIAPDCEVGARGDAICGIVARKALEGKDER